MGDETLEAVDGSTVRIDSHGKLAIGHIYYSDSEMRRFAESIESCSQTSVGLSVNIADDDAAFDASVTPTGSGFALVCEAHAPVIATKDEWLSLLPDEQESFEDYVRGNITYGTYEYDDDHELCDLRLTEYVVEDDVGHGFITPYTIRSAVEDENVIVNGVGSGWLELKRQSG